MIGAGEGVVRSPVRSGSTRPIPPRQAGLKGTIASGSVIRPPFGGWSGQPTGATSAVDHEPTIYGRGRRLQENDNLRRNQRVFSGSIDRVKLTKVLGMLGVIRRRC